MCCVCSSSSGGSLQDGAAGPGQLWQGAHGSRWPWAAHAQGDSESYLSEVDIEELCDFSHEPPLITQQHLKVVRSPNMFVSPFCCS